MSQTKQFSPDAGGAYTEGAFRGTRLGWIDHLRNAVPWVDFEGNPQGPLPARSICVGLEALQAAASTRQPVVLIFDEQQEPVVLGLIQPEPRIRQQPLPAPPPGTLTGQRVMITAQQRLEIQCGGARITLDSTGEVRIQGEKIETRAMRTAQLQGDEVEVN